MKQNFVLFILVMLTLTACGINPSINDAGQSTTSTTTTTTVVGGTEPAARFIFHKDNFTDLSDFVANPQTNFKCLGDVVKTYYSNGDDYNGTPTAFPLDTTVTDSLNPTTRPVFVKNVSVDMTNSYFPTVVAGTLQSDGCSYQGISGAASPAPCADFDEQITVVPTPTIAPTVTPVPTATATPNASITPTPTPVPSPSPFFGTKFYHVKDDWCAGQGPILSNNPDTTKTNVGGVNIDLDRTQLGATEDLLMNVTYQAYNANSAWPAPQTSVDETIMRVDLIGTTLGLDLLLGAKQPRAWNDYQAAAYPIYFKQLVTLRDPSSSLRTEQVYIPLSENSLIDRIRLERVRGSYHLFQIDLYRLGNRSE